MGGETWSEKLEVLANVSDTLTETTGSVIVAGGMVESLKSGVESGMVVCGRVETGGRQGAMMIVVVEVLVKEEEKEQRHCTFGLSLVS